MRARNIRIERIKYAADIRKLADQELGYLSSQRVLDAGCGTGLVSRIIKNKYPRIRLTGVDNDSRDIRTAIRIAKKRCANIKFTSCSLEALPFRSDTFDVVISTLVMHHMPAKARTVTLREFYRTLKREGRLMLLEGKGLVRGLDSMIRTAGFIRVRKKAFGKMRRVYLGQKQ